MKISLVALLGGSLLLAGCATVPISGPSSGIQIGSYKPPLRSEVDVRSANRTASLNLSCGFNVGTQAGPSVFATTDRVRAIGSQMTQATLASASARLPSDCRWQRISSTSEFEYSAGTWNSGDAGGRFRVDVYFLPGFGPQVFAVPLGTCFGNCRDFLR